MSVYATKMNDENIYLIMVQKVFCSQQKQNVNAYAVGPKPKSFPEKGKYSLAVSLSGKILGLKQNKENSNGNCNFSLHMEN